MCLLLLVVIIQRRADRTKLHLVDFGFPSLVIAVNFGIEFCYDCVQSLHYNGVRFGKR
jgi:hypothetical protein